MRISERLRAASGTIGQPAPGDRLVPVHDRLAGSRRRGAGIGLR
jgi:hypothetical protein